MIYKDCETVYSSCLCNCGSNSQCVFKLFVKDGKVLAVEPDDRLNTKMAREDTYIDETEIFKTNLQRRPCTRGLVFHKYLYQPDRIIYPMKRVTGTKRGEGKYERISWDEALDTIVSKMNAAREKYGPYSVATPFANSMAEQLFSHWGAGVDCWGWSSFDSGRLMSHLVAGERGWNYPAYSSGTASDMLANSKWILVFGQDSTVGMQGPGYQFAYYLKLARERGKEIVIIDPRYTNAGEVLADQWIPIKPGTDNACFCALAYVLFVEDTWDKEFVAKYVEPKGFRAWQNMIMGVSDGVVKTPEWAEQHCAIPAETIWALGHKLGTVKPAWVWNHWATTRKSRGEATMRNFAALQAMLGYWGTPGAGPAFHPGPMHDIPVVKPYAPMGNYHVPKLYRSHKFAEAILNLAKVRSGEKDPNEYMREVGWRADTKILADFNPKVLFWGGFNSFAANHMDCACESPNLQIPAMEKFDFIINMHNRFTATVRMADLILPSQDDMWEEQNVTKSSYGCFDSINYCAGISTPPGEVRPKVWIYCKIAEGLGIDPKKIFSYYTGEDNWQQDWDNYQRACYQEAIDYYAKRGQKVASWEDFKKGQFINCDAMDDEPLLGWQKQLKEGKPFRTESGKLEFFSNYIADEENKKKGVHYDKEGQIYDNLPTDWASITPGPVWLPAVQEFPDGDYEEYPLAFMSSVSRYRVHSLFWEQPWLRNQVYRHRVWINVNDAAKRGIKDDDSIEVYNKRGKVLMPAYVTSRIMPGIVLVRHGAGYTPNAEGVDVGASPSTLLGGDNVSSVVPAHASSRVQVKKYAGGDKQ